MSTATSIAQATTALPGLGSGLPASQRATCGGETGPRHSLVAESTSTFEDAVESVITGKYSLDEATEALLACLSPEERLWLLDGDVEFYDGLRVMFQERYNIRPFVMGSLPRLGIPGIRFTDGPRGVCIGNSTTFPVSMARGATFDIELEEDVGRAIGREARAQGANFFAGVCVNLLRHPAWGRSQETYGEDSLLLGAFGTALSRGVQENVMACVKHFALNSMENARFEVDVKVDDSSLHEIYLPHFKRVIDAGAVGVMSAYNSVNGEWAGQSDYLLNNVLRGLWQFSGLVMSDFIFGLRDSALSLKHGLDIEAPFRQQRAVNLRPSIDNGEASWTDVDRAAERILKKQLQYHAEVTSDEPSPSVVYNAEHRKLARKVAARSVVLLKNDRIDGAPLLPLDVGRLRSIAIVGRLAKAHNTGDLGSSRVISPHVTTLAEGLEAAIPSLQITVDDSDDVQSARDAASTADLVICIVGNGARDEGEYVVPSLEQNPALEKLLPIPRTAEEEAVAAVIRGTSKSGSDGIEVGGGGDRRSLRLRPQDQEIVKTVTAVNPRTVVSLVCGGAVLMGDTIQDVPAAMIGWYSGCEGGHGLADVLLGRMDATGRLPFSIPQSEKHLPSFQIDAKEITYDRWHGQRLLDKMHVPAAFPFGFGLSYTTFEISDLEIETNRHAQDMHESLLIRVNVTNTGIRDGRFIAQAYGLPGLADFPVRVLVGFKPVDLRKGESRPLMITASTQPLSRWEDDRIVLPHKAVEFEVGAFAGDPAAMKASFHVQDEEHERHVNKCM